MSLFRSAQVGLRSSLRSYSTVPGSQAAVNKAAAAQAAAYQAAASEATVDQAAYNRTVAAQAAINRAAAEQAARDAGIASGSPAYETVGTSKPTTIAYDASAPQQETLGDVRGAGSFFSGQAKGTAQEAYGEARGAANSLAGQAKGAAQETVGEAKAAGSWFSGKAQGAAQETLGEAKGAANSVSGQAKGAAQEAYGEARGAANSLSGSAKGAVEEAKGAASSVSGQAKGAAYSAEQKAKSAAQDVKQAVTPSPGPIVVGRPTIRRPVGSVRGGFMGFLLGFGLASGYGYYYLLKEYNAASNLMLASVEELQSSTDKITTHLQRLNKLESDLKTLSSGSASKSDYEKNRSEMKRIVDGLHDEVLDIKKRVIGK